jgi:hypothetical protein
MALRRLQHGTQRRKQLPPSAVVRLTSDSPISLGLVSCSHTSLVRAMAEDSLVMILASQSIRMHSRNAEITLEFQQNEWF